MQKTISKFSAIACLVTANFSVVLAQAGDSIGDVVRKADGSVWTMNQYDAEKYCKDHGSRLPTARELALYSQSLGARGMRETAYPDIAIDGPVDGIRAEIYQMAWKDDYLPILTKNAVGARVMDFYFNHNGYQRPAGDLGKYWFWSSSVRPLASFSDTDEAYALNGPRGDIFEWPRSFDNAIGVRCMQ